jgi:hypothetical protein
MVQAKMQTYIMALYSSRLLRCAITLPALCLARTWWRAINLIQFNQLPNLYNFTTLQPSNK